ncbi:MAG: hypothetical protein WD059_04295 [Balneolaceae bacterium]
MINFYPDGGYLKLHFLLRACFLKTTIFLFVLLFPFCLFAQADMEDVIYLKNGGILRGEIIEMKTNNLLKIKTTGRNVIVVLMEDVEEIQKEEIPQPEYFKKTGYVNYTGLDILPGDVNSTTLRYQMVNGYQFSPVFSAGIGIGFTAYNDPLNAIPLFIDLRLKFLKANTSPFVFLKTGYNFSLSPDMEETQFPIEDHSGGFLINPGLGIQFDNREGVGWYFNAGFNNDTFTYEQQEWNGRILETELSYKRIHFGFGLVF